MGGKPRRERKQLLLYYALCLMLLTSGCIYSADRQAGIYLKNADYRKAYDLLANSDNESAENIFTRILLHSAPDSPYYSCQKTVEYSEQLSRLYPESHFTHYAAVITKISEQMKDRNVLIESLSTELSRTAEAIRKQAALKDELTEKLENENSRNTELEEISESLNRQLQIIRKENERLKMQLEMMKNVDLAPKEL